jgi:hypothetical protein
MPCFRVLATIDTHSPRWCLSASIQAPISRLARCLAMVPIVRREVVVRRSYSFYAMLMSQLSDLGHTYSFAYKWCASEKSNVRGSQLQYSEWNWVQTVSQGSFMDVRARDESSSVLFACQGSMSSTIRSPLTSSWKP